MGDPSLFLWLVRAACALLVLSVGIAPRALAHDIPNEVRVQAFVKPEGGTLHVVVRVPMAAMTEVEIPKQGFGGYIDLARAEPALRDAVSLWFLDNMKVFEEDTTLAGPAIEAVRVSLPSDFSYRTYEGALAHLAGPRLKPDLDLPWQQALLDAHITFPIRSESARFSIDPQLQRLGRKVSITLRFLPPRSPERAFELHGNAGRVHLDPSWTQAASYFVRDGFAHILDGTDHLLFILCLVVPFRRLGPLALVVTAFTVAHSITLIGSALGMAPRGLWFPPLVEVLVAASILYMALENIVGVGLRRRWLLTFAFGLVHGFGFSFALQESLQFAGSHLVTALLAFNAGVELGQLAVLAVLVPALGLAFRFVPERAGVIILSAFVAHTAWHWLAERWEALRKFPWPGLDAAGGALLLRWAMVLVAVAAVAWLARLAAARWRAAARGSAR